MKIIRTIRPGDFKFGSVVSIGNFDGIHLGHQAIVKRVVEKSEKRSIPSIITTFEPHPHEFFNPDSTDRIMGLREKYIALKKLNPDYLFVMRFNCQLASTSAEEFIDKILLQGLNIKGLIVGDDFRFGQKRQGDYHLLKQYAQQHSFELENTSTFEIDDLRISSTRIRELLRDCKFDDAEQLLGRPFFVSGRVAHGEKRGRQLGFPTLNVRLTKNRTLVSGVFAVEVHGLGAIKHGVANMGYRPTLHGQRPQLEVHVFDFDRQCYGEQIKVVFRHKLRDEKRFDTIELLRDQINIDAHSAREYLFSRSVNG